MTVLVTGSAGFIGSAITIKLLDEGNIVVGIDNHNDYYDPLLKESRLSRHVHHENYHHIRMDIEDSNGIKGLFESYNFDSVIHLAAQAGVRYSIENPQAYIQSNLVGFGNILEGCRMSEIQHLVYASSSSVYGGNTKLPFSEGDSVDHPQSLYAASKKANELMAHTYSHLYNIPSTGLRFFTVYGPWSRPDMALYKFTESILNGKKIKVFNHGKHRRDFTYIDDIVNAVLKVLKKPAVSNKNWKDSLLKNSSSEAPWRIYNIGSNSPIALMDYIKAIEKALNLKAKKVFLPRQPGDVIDTFADSNDLARDFSYKPSTPLQYGIDEFVEWFKMYHKV
jgi:UDP-glucuronate 4-epimerase